jgi:hypothetical protein
VDAPAEETGDEFTRLECVDADWVDELGAPPGLLTQPDYAEEAEGRVSMILFRENLGFEGAILELRLDESPEEDDVVHHYLTLTGEPVMQRVESIHWPRREEAERIAATTRIGAEDAAESEVRDALSIVPAEVEAVAVYDVGQGSCSALIAHGAPVLYFDLGAGSLNGRGSRPSNLGRLCPSPHTIVISHWHVDHWALAKQGGTGLLERTWIVPRQPLGAASATLLGLIRRHGRALVRSHDPTLYEGAVSLHSCTGTSLNDSGQAMVVRDRRGGRPIVLPGDARYSRIEDLPREAHALVVAHHGGWTGARAEEIPAPELDDAGGPDPAASLAYSFGYDNSYRHPSPESEREHTAAGWGAVTQLRTGERTPVTSRDHEHSHLYWSSTAPPVRLRCGGAGCDLAPCKRA